MSTASRAHSYASMTVAACLLCIVVGLFVARAARAQSLVLVQDSSAPMPADGGYTYPYVEGTPGAGPGKQVYAPTFPLFTCMFFVLLGIAPAVTASALAKEKGRNAVLWALVGLIPLVGFYAVIYLAGLTSQSLELRLIEMQARLDELSAAAE
jgi:hypothetical protein